MKLKLFIHIGQPKTGSSAIQAFLNYNRENLVKKHHLLYPNFSGIDLGKGLLHNHEKVFTNAKLNNDYNGCIETFNKCKTYCEHNKITQVVLSNESFGWYWWPELLKQIIATLDCDFKIILYLRRQDHWIESAWKQWGHKCNEYSTIQDFSEKFNMDWNLPLKQWLTFFSPSDFIVRPFERNVIGNDVVKDFPEFNSKVYLGGPVQNDSLFFIHTLGDKVENSLEIIPGIYWGGDIERIRELIELSLIKPSQIRFFIGYSGWSPNQLDEELERNSWVVSNVTADDLLRTTPSMLWSRSLRRLGVEYAHWIKFPDDPTDN